ncbi:hypothetical protein F5887DRAFT_931351 [Amanita rubescens]|nr:hypothetical protein F5887DRAFT_931351 [Amanita rubescens]
MAPIAIDTTRIPAKTRQIILILLIFLGFAIICALLGYCVATLTKFYRLRRREKERAKKISDIERQAKTASNKERGTPNASPIPTFPATAYFSPRERQVQIAAIAGWPVGLFDNVSRHADAAPTSHPTCSSCGSPTNKPVSEADSPRPDGEIHSSPNAPVSHPSEEIDQRDSPITTMPIFASIPRPDGEVHQSSPSPHPSEEIDQRDSSITIKPISASMPRPSVDDSAPRSLPIPPIVAKMMSAPPSHYDIVRVPTITMNDRYPLVQSSSKGAPSSGKLQLPTDGHATMNATLQVHKFLASKSEGSVLNTTGGNTPGSLTSLPHAKPRFNHHSHNNLS